MHRAVWGAGDVLVFYFPRIRDANHRTTPRYFCTKHRPTQNVLGQTLTSASQHAPLMVIVLWIEIWIIRANVRLKMGHWGFPEWLVRIPSVCIGTLTVRLCPCILLAYFCKNESYPWRRTEWNLEREHNWILVTNLEWHSKAPPTLRLFCFFSQYI